MASDGKQTIWGLERNVFFTGLTSFLTDVSIKMIYSIMPLFLLSIGASKTSIALIEGIAESTASAFKVFSGYLSDRIGRNKPFMIVGYGITAIVTPFLSFATNYLHVLILRFAERIGKGIRTAPRDSLISGSVRAAESGKNFGFHKAMDNSGAIIGPLAAFLLLFVFPDDFRIIFILATIPAVLGVVSIVAFIKEAKAPTVGDAARPRLKELPRRFYLFLAIVFVFTLGNSADAFLLIKTAETGIQKTMVPFLYMLFNVVSVFLAIPIGKYSDRTDRETLIIAGFALYSIVYFFFGFSDSIGVYILMFVLYGIYSALADGSQKALISDLIPKELRGTGFGLYHAVLGATLLPASLIAGLLYDGVGSSAPFYFGSVMAFIATILMIMFALFKRRPKPSAKESLTNC